MLGQPARAAHEQPVAPGKTRHSRSSFERGQQAVGGSPQVTCTRLFVRGALLLLIDGHRGIHVDLAELQRDVGVCPVPRLDLGHRPHRRSSTDLREETVHAGREFVVQHGHLVVVTERRQYHVDQYGAGRTQRNERLLVTGQRMLVRLVLVIVRRAAHDADPEPGQRARYENRRLERRRCGGRGRIGRIRSGDHCEQCGRVGNGPGHRAGGVLARRDRQDAGTADQAHGGLHADQALMIGRTRDGTVRLRTDGQRGQTERGGGAGPAAGPARGDRCVVRVEHLAAE